MERERERVGGVWVDVDTNTMLYYSEVYVNHRFPCIDYIHRSHNYSRATITSLRLTHKPSFGVEKTAPVQPRPCNTAAPWDGEIGCE